MNNNNENTDNGDTFEIVPLKPKKAKLDAGKYPGRFTKMAIDKTAKRDGSPRKDLILTVKLDKPKSGQPATLDQVFNLLPGKRGQSHFKSCMESFLQRDITDEELAKFDKNTVLNEQVVCSYEQNKLGNAVVFKTYLPAGNKN